MPNSGQENSGEPEKPPKDSAAEFLPEPPGISGRPLVHLNGGAVGLLAVVGGGLDRVCGSGKDRHISPRQLRKEIDPFEEADEDGAMTIHEWELFAHELALVLITGETAILK